MVAVDLPQHLPLVVTPLGKPELLERPAPVTRVEHLDEGVVHLDVVDLEEVHSVQKLAPASATAERLEDLDRANRGFSGGHRCSLHK
ncbi:MAG: hypothetical protein IPG97_15425 [Microthrixaceae bacterium]|nr:hypothetical protein [Microthrixaceae bacterium]